MKESLNPEWWRKRLQGPLPGEGAQLRMAPAFRGSFPWQEKPVHAAVLALLYPSRGDTHLVFIKRNEYDGPHSAQVSFPGGAREAGDLSLEETALRETREETGVTGSIEILGSLTPLHIPVSNYMVYPFLGWMEETPEFDPDPTEVQYLIEVSLKELLDPAHCDSETIRHHDRAINAPFYRVGKDKIWGATAMMLSELLQLTGKLP
ncbi:MAG: CoA pyrophosphatase [Bacteroidales bacterium]|nr:CoA pyrophosphatase [Bacteroidales bacterium]